MFAPLVAVHDTPPGHPGLAERQSAVIGRQLLRVQYREAGFGQAPAQPRGKNVVEEAAAAAGDRAHSAGPRRSQHPGRQRFDQCGMECGRALA